MKGRSFVNSYFHTTSMTIIAYSPIVAAALFNCFIGNGIESTRLLWPGILYGGFALSIAAAARMSSIQGSILTNNLPNIALKSGALLIVIWISILVITMLSIPNTISNKLDFNVPIKLAVLSASILSLLHYLSVDTAISNWRHRTEFEDEIPKEMTRNTNRYFYIYRNTITWVAGPVVVSLTITGLTYFMANYQGTIVNHATIFGVYLAVAFVLKQKVEELGEETQKYHNGSNNPD